jgi:hypothetical protein
MAMLRSHLSSNDSSLEPARTDTNQAHDPLIDQFFRIAKDPDVVEKTADLVGDSPQRKIKIYAVAQQVLGNSFVQKVETILRGRSGAKELQQFETAAPELNQLSKDEVNTRSAALDEVIAHKNEVSLSTVLGTVAERYDVRHEQQINEKGVGEFEGNNVSADAKTPGAGRTDCTIFVENILRDGLAATGQSGQWAAIQSAARASSKKRGAYSGVDLQMALQSVLGWKGLYLAEAPLHDPGYATRTHEYASGKTRAIKPEIDAADRGRYFGAHVDGVHTARGSLDSKAEDNLAALRDVAFGVVSLDAGDHMVVIVRGMVYEVHRQKSADDRELFEATQIELDDRLGQSFVVMSPTDYASVMKAKS